MLFFFYQESSFEMDLLENKLRILENTQILRQGKMEKKIFFCIFIFSSSRNNFIVLYPCPSLAISAIT